MSYRNTYTKPQAAEPDLEGLLDPSIPFDVNFVYELEPLRNDRVRLEPFVPAIYAQDLFHLYEPTPELFKYIPMGPWKDLNDLLAFFDTYGRRRSDWALFAVLDTSKGIRDEKWGDGELAGIVALMNVHPENLSAEIGAIIIGKKFQRTHVSSNVIGLLLEWSFTKLGLRRVQWQANHLNEPSVQAAKKMGFTMEGVLRWERTIPLSKRDVGETVIRDGEEQIPSRHTAMLSMSWVDWNNGLKDLVAQRMSRTS
ncbi:acyl-CoA N-acyltransferase [Serendipita vermifera]|nr:acyl-CoA N-acyltransferase [Serendipita vermifera]